MLGGYANRVAQIDLTAGMVKYEEINEDDARNLAPERWNRQRKSMRKQQFDNDMQQSY